MDRKPARNGQKKALFVRQGKFSHVNASLLAALRRARPDITFEDFNLSERLPQRSLAFQKCIAGAVLEYGLKSLRNRDQLRFCVLRSGAYFRATRREIRQRLQAEDYAFTIQTQTLFNAACGDVPNFIYTDHAARARRTATWDEGFGAPSKRWLPLEASIYADAAHVFTFGSRLRQSIMDLYGLDGARVSCAGTGANTLPDCLPDTGPDRYARRKILFAGIEWERKGGPDLLAAFRILSARLPGVTLDIVGCRPPEAEGVPGCTVLGRVSIADLARLYAEASCLCVPSRHEPFGNVFVEAGHFGLPVVATRVGEIADVVEDGVNGFRVPPSDPEALATALWQVLGDPETASRMGAAGRRITQDYTWERVAERILDHAPVGRTGGAHGRLPNEAGVIG